MNEWMMGVLGHDSALLIQDWAGDNLGEWDEVWCESCPLRRIDRSTCRQAVQGATIVPRMPPIQYIKLGQEMNGILFHCKAIQGRGKPGLMRWILMWNTLQVQDRVLDLLTCSPVRYHWPPVEWLYEKQCCSCTGVRYNDILLITRFLLFQYPSMRNHIGYTVNLDILIFVS